MSDFAIDFGLKGRTVVVTGAAQGTGQAVAAATAHAGADVALLDLAEDRLDATAARVRETGRRPLVLGVDIGDRLVVLAAV